jgi:hypothetical protein
LAEELLRRKSTKLICEGRYTAQVAIEYWYDESWSPMMSIEDARKLERVRLALRRADIAEAAKDGQVANACGGKYSVASVAISWISPASRFAHAGYRNRTASMSSRVSRG